MSPIGVGKFHGRTRVGLSKTLIHSGFQGFVFDIRFCSEALDTRLPKQFLGMLSKS